MSKTKETAKKLPSHRIYAINGEGDDAVWIELGAAWEHKDRKGFRLQFKALPLPGAQLVLREPLPPKNED